MFPVTEFHGHQWKYFVRQTSLVPRPPMKKGGLGACAHAYISPDSGESGYLSKIIISKSTFVNYSYRMRS